MHMLPIEITHWLDTFENNDLQYSPDDVYLMYLTNHSHMRIRQILDSVSLEYELMEILRSSSLMDMVLNHHTI